MKIFTFALRIGQLFECECKNQTIQFRVKISSMYHYKSPVSCLSSIHFDVKIGEFDYINSTNNSWRIIITNANVLKQVCLTFLYVSMSALFIISDTTVI